MAATGTEQYALSALRSLAASSVLSGLIMPAASRMVIITAFKRDHERFPVFGDDESAQYFAVGHLENGRKIVLAFEIFESFFDFSFVHECFSDKN